MFVRHSSSKELKVSGCPTRYEEQSRTKVSSYSTLKAYSQGDSLTRKQEDPFPAFQRNASMPWIPLKCIEPQIPLDTQRSNAFWQIFAWDYKSLELFEAFLLFWYWILKRLRWEREALSKVLKGTSSICPRFYFAASLHFAPSGFFCTRFSKFPTPKKFLKEILVLRSSQFKAW